MFLGVPMLKIRINEFKGHGFHCDSDLGEPHLDDITKFKSSDNYSQGKNTYFM